MDLTMRDENGARWLRIEEARIDAAGSIGFKDAVRAAARGGPDRIVLDLERVEFVDSSGLGALVAAMKLLAPEQRLEVARLHPNVARVFALTRMDKVFTIHEGEEGVPDAA